MASFAYAPRPNKFTSVHFKRWKEKAMILFQAMKVYSGLVMACLKEISLRKIKENSMKPILSLWDIFLVFLLSSPG